VAEQWYVATALDPGITMIREPHVHPLLQANIWHIRGRDRDLVVDSGLGVAPLRPAFPDLFDRDPVVVLTHGHLDHMGGAHEFDECHAHPGEHVTHPSRGTLNAKLLAQILGLSETALTEPLPEWLISALPEHRYDPAAYELKPARVARAVADGDRFDLGDRTLTVLHLPGHTPGSVALYDTQSAALFSGDVVYDLPPGEELLDDLDGADIDDYVATMRRLATLDIEVVYPGHGDVFRASRLRHIVDDYIASRRERIVRQPAPGRPSCT
jgi:glyoxylase-like metal-dependent hydrolase (beta-lactamase superfamily II)